MRLHSRVRSGSAIGLALLLLLVSQGATGTAEAADLPRWRWPLSGTPTVVEPFRAPAHEYGAGHRGVDLASSVGAVAVAPAEGIVAFRGTVVDRPLLTIAHADGFVTTFEPLRSSLDPGDPVSTGQEIGTVDTGGHAPAGTLHVGVRRNGGYLNPLLLFGEIPRSILLPCCAPL
ncbi:murein hydrolase activator EnvC family protein [Microbacterium paraoxydans]|uniref:murein hydrolase activator EnvC family protein n=1 Tax=Microbacterium paraoxydans TaxID=199592 RepID=UPI001CFB7C15|nr:M23 family metallopeptidase [Microbacterium paraoxydans]